jgi:hypothetical protein
VRVELGILHVRIVAASVHGEQRQAALGDIKRRGLVFWNDDDGGRADDDARTLVGRALDAAGDHQADVDAVAGHVAGGEGVEDCVGE